MTSHASSEVLRSVGVPRDTTEATATAAITRKREDGPGIGQAPYLFAVLHCDAPQTGGARYCLRALDEVVITRGPARASRRDVGDDGRSLTVEVADARMSRRQVVLRRAMEQWVLTDEGSKNGVFVNRQRVTRARLADGDVIECGQTLFLFRASLPFFAGAADDYELGAQQLGDVATLSPTLEESYRVLKAIAASTLPVLLLGPTGTGKEIAAKAVHALSGRRGAFVPLNCGAIPAGLLESQLFGHSKGAFTGATRDELGSFRAANEGTLFLDELGDLPLASQVAFLRALEDRAVTPVGTTRSVPVDVRVVAATNKPLDALVAQGAFREDLLARLSSFTHRLVALGDRIEDIGVLVATLIPQLREHGSVRFTTEAGHALLSHSWPMNIRELRSCLASALVIAGGEDIDLPHLLATMSTRAPTTSSDDAADTRERLVALLEEHRGNIAAVARAMGKAPAQVHRWLRRYDIDVNSFRLQK